LPHGLLGPVNIGIRLMLSRPVDGGIPVFNYLFLSALHNFETCKIKQKKLFQ
jgi:hypothetical protein